jgi:hypothetical protein
LETEDAKAGADVAVAEAVYLVLACCKNRKKEGVAAVGVGTFAMRAFHFVVAMAALVAAGAIARSFQPWVAEAAVLILVLVH